MIQDVKIGKEIIIVTKNEVGVLSSIAKILASKGINIAAISAHATGDTAILRMVMNGDGHGPAASALREKEYSVEEENVVLLTVQNKPGTLLKIAAELASQKVDFCHNYGSVVGDQNPCLLVVCTNDNQKALLALRKLQG